MVLPSKIPTLPVHLAILQPTTFCNIDCRYCYLPDRSNVRKMSLEVAEQTLRFLFRDAARVARQLTVLWHSGEPMSQSLAFYEAVYELEQKYCPISTTITNSIQTNGTLLNQRWCDFIRRSGMKIGVSIDGPRWLHDKNRRDRAGKGTFDRVIAGINLLKENNIEFSVIAVLSDNSLDHADEIWEFFRDLGVKALHFLAEEIQGVHSTTSVGPDNRLARVRSFYGRLLELRRASKCNISIRDLDYFLAGVPVWRGTVKAIEQLPLGIVNVSWDGKVTTFSPELLGFNSAEYGELVFAKVADDSLESMLSNPTFLAVYRDILAGMKRCQCTCEYFNVCGGGQPSNKYFENGSFDSTETLTCQTKIKAACDVVLQRMEKDHGFTSNEGASIVDRISRLQPLLQRPQKEQLSAFEFV